MRRPPRPGDCTVLSSLWLPALVALSFAGQSEAVPFEAEALPFEDEEVMPPPPAVPSDPLADESAPRRESTPPRLDEREPRAHVVDEDMPLRVVGALCGGLFGFYIGQFASPLLTVPVMAVGLLGLFLVGPALLSSAPPAAIVFAPFCLWGGVGAVGLVLPVTGAIVLATLGYEHAPAVVGSLSARWSKGPPPPERDEAMAY